MIQADHYCQQNPRKLKAWAYERTEVSGIGEKNRIQERKCKELGTAWKGQQDQQVGGRQKKKESRWELLYVLIEYSQRSPHGQHPHNCAHSISALVF